MRGYAQTALLFLLGGTLLKLAWTGTYMRYVREAHRPALVVAGVALLVVALANLWRDLRNSRRPDDDTATGLRLEAFFGSERLRSALTAPTRVLAAARPRRAAPPASAPMTDTSEVMRGSARESAELDYQSPGRTRAVAAGWAAAEHEGLAEVSETPAHVDSPTALLGAVPAEAPTAAYDTVQPEPSTEAFLAFRTRSDDRTDAPDLAEAEPARVGGAPVASARGTVGGWALLVAVLAVLLLSPPALGPFMAHRDGTITAAASPASVPPDDPVSLSLVDYVAHAAAGGEALADRQVRLVGFVVAGPRGEPYLVRLAVGCCAAGARPVKVGLTGGLPVTLVPDQWVAAVGTYSDRVDPDPVNGEPIPYLSVVELTIIDPPADPYES